MNSPSFLARAARVLLVTSLALVALILMATYASSGSHRSTMSLREENEQVAISNAIAPSVGGMMGSTGSSSITMFYDKISDDYDGNVAASATSTTAPASTSSDKIIKTGSIDMTAEDVSQTTDAITNAATGLGGFVQNASRSEDEDGIASAYMTIRVPNDQFDAARIAIKALATHVNSESVQGDDVTEQYTDLSARLTAAKAQEAQYLTILATAKTVGDVLAVQEHLAIVRADIESLQGQITYLENRTSLSTISVTISEEPSGVIPSSNDKFDLGRDAALAWAFLVAGAKKFLSAAVWVLIVGAPIVILAGIVALIARAIRNRSQRPAPRRK